LNEGRVITAEFQNFILVNVYTPNSKRQLERLGQRQIWDKGFTNHLLSLQKKHNKPIICSGDLNVAHQEIDLARPKQNTKNAGFTQEERSGIQHHIDSGFIDTFRHLHPDTPEKYSWWSYQAKSRERNVGWRIDYFLLSQPHLNILKEAQIHPEVHGSDHCPVSIVIQ
jgi:exodeoxyribonuclease-3